MHAGFSERKHTLKPDTCVWIDLVSFGLRLDDALLIVVAVNLIAFFVDQGRVATDYGALVASVFNGLDDWC